MNKSLGNVYILGDSYSTYDGWIPEGNPFYYSKENDDEREEKSGVVRVEDTWWYKLINETNSKLVLNNSFSGSTICNTGYDGLYVPKSSFVGRFESDLNAGVFKDNAVDTILIFGATNDSWAGSPYGEVKYDNISSEDLKSIFPATCYLLSKASKNCGNSKIIFIRNTELKKEIGETIEDICNTLNVQMIPLDNIDKAGGHPTLAGMEEIKNQILAHLR